MKVYCNNCKFFVDPLMGDPYCFNIKAGKTYIDTAVSRKINYFNYREFNGENNCKNHSCYDDTRKYELDKWYNNYILLKDDDFTTFEEWKIKNNKDIQSNSFINRLKKLLKKG